MSLLDTQSNDIFDLIMNPLSWDKNFYKFTRDEKDMYPYSVQNNKDGSITIVHNVVWLDKKDVKLTTTIEEGNGYILISGETKDEITGKIYKVNSRFSCNKAYDLNNINSQMRNGLLYITIGAKKVKTPSVRTVEIN